MPLLVRGPRAAAPDGPLPPGASARRALLSCCRLETAFGLPGARYLVGGGVPADAQTGQEGGTERRRLQHRRAHDRQAQQVGLELHQEVVGSRAAVHAHLRDADGGVGDHRL